MGEVTVHLAGRAVHVIPDTGSEGIRAFIENEARRRSLADDERAFFVMNLGDVVEKYRQWVRLLPNVTPFYSVKCNSDPVLLNVMARLGAGFDCASSNELQLIVEQSELPVHPSRIVYANPIKQISNIRYAAQHGVDTMTFDCREELVKIKKYHPKAKLIVRVRPNPRRLAKNEVCEMPETTAKFGCSVSEAINLLSAAEGLDLDVIGVSFYAGHRCYDPSVYNDCISSARSVFNAAAAMTSRERHASRPRQRLHVLDIGGGFYGETKCRLPFANAATAIQSAIDEHFGDLVATGDVRIIGEPGAYIATSSCTLVANVIGVRLLNDRSADEEINCTDGRGSSTCESPNSYDSSKQYHYFVNDGIYGSFRCYNAYNKARKIPNVPFRIAREPSARVGDLHESANKPTIFPCTIWGPTSGGADWVDNCRLEQLEIGDWLAFEDMGQYSFCLTSEFNGMLAPVGCYVIEQRYTAQLGLQN